MNAPYTDSTVDGVRFETYGTESTRAPLLLVHGGGHAARSGKKWRDDWPNAVGMPCVSSGSP